MIDKDNIKFKGFIQITNLIVTGFGVLVLLGWVFDVDFLKSIIPGFSTMKFNTALSFVVIASSIYFQFSYKISRKRFIWKSASAFVLAMGLLSLSEEFIGRDFGIDQLFFRGEETVTPSSNPFRMAAATAFSFILLGFFSVTMGTKNKLLIQVSQIALHIVTLMAFTAFMGYLLGVPKLYKHWFINTMAVHTSLCFLLLSLSSSLVNPNSGITAYFIGKQIGNVMARKLFFQMLIAILILAYLRILTTRLEWVTVEFGIALFALSFILVSLALIRRTAIALNTVDTGKVQAESNLQQTSHILDSTPDPMIIIDQSGTILLSNLQTQQVFGYTEEELKGQKVEVLIPERFHHHHINYRSSFFKAPKTRSMGSGHELFARRRDGKEVPVEVSLSPIQMENETWVSAAIRDVTARRLEEIKLNQLVSIIDSSADAIVSKKTDGTILSWNAAAERILGYSAEEILGKNISLIFPSELLQEEKQLMEQITQGKIVSQHETLRVRKDQKKINVSITLSPIRDSKGEIWAVSAILRDITEQKQKAAEKRRIEEVLERTNEVARIGAWEVDLIKNTVYWSKITKEIHEVPQDFIPDLAGGVEFYKEGKSRDTIQNVVGEAIATGKTFDVELEIVTAKKNIRWVRSIGQTEFEDGKCVRLYGVFQDIDEITKSKEALNVRNQELQAILNAGHVSIIGTDTTGIITHFNEGAERLLQYTADEMVGKQTPAIVHKLEEVVSRGKELTEIYGSEISGFEVFVRKARDGKYESREWTYTRKDGTSFPVQLIVTAIKNKEGEITGFLGVATDISERKETEEKLRKYSILESKSKEMEQFAYVASHDLREPLLTIINYIDALEEEYGNRMDGDGEQYMKSISRAAGRMDELIKGLLDYSRLSAKKELKETDFNQVLSEALADLNALITLKKAQIESDELPSLKAYPLEIKLLFQNLIANAIKFSKNGSDPIVKISAHPITKGWQFEVTDNGIGVDEKDWEKIFLMFQRIHGKSEYEGTGIGLAHCKKIVELHNGNIWIDSTPGEFSTFYFTIMT